MERAIEVLHMEKEVVELDILSGKGNQEHMKDFVDAVDVLCFFYEVLLIDKEMVEVRNEKRLL